MKKITTTLVLTLISTASFATTYECTGYVGSKPVATIKIQASKMAVAETKSHDRMRKDGTKVDYVKCK